MDALAEKLGITIDFYAALIFWGLIFTRIFVMLILTPFLGGRGISGRMRLAIGIVLATFVFSMIGVDSVNKLPEDKGLIFALFFKEIFLGLTIGITTIMCFYAIEAGGRIVDSQRGSANAQIFLPQLGQVSIFGLFQFWLGLTLFLAMSAHVPFLRAFFEGFEVFPVTTLPHLEIGVSDFMKFIIRMSAQVLEWGMQLAAPVLIAIFLTDLVLGIANKMAPQIPVFELGFLLKGFVGVVMVYVSIYILTTQMGTFFDIMNKNVVEAIRHFAA